MTEKFDEEKWKRETACEVCGRSPVIGVASSCLGAISFAFCPECIVQRAEPIGMFQYIYDDVSDNGESVSEAMNTLNTWQDGKYISWLEYKKQRQEQLA